MPTFTTTQALALLKLSLDIIAWNDPVDSLVEPLAQLSLSKSLIKRSKMQLACKLCNKLPLRIEVVVHLNIVRNFSVNNPCFDSVVLEHVSDIFRPHMEQSYLYITPCTLAELQVGYLSTIKATSGQSRFQRLTLILLTTMDSMLTSTLMFVSMSLQLYSTFIMSIH